MRTAKIGPDLRLFRVDQEGEQSEAFDEQNLSKWQCSRFFM